MQINSSWQAQATLPFCRWPERGIVIAQESHVDPFVAAGGDREMPKAILCLTQEYLDAAFDGMHEKDGTIKKCFLLGLCVNIAQRQALRTLHLH